MAEYKKSRTPYYFKDDDYDNFLRGIEKYHDDHGGDPDFYPHWAILAPLIGAFHADFQAYKAAQQLIEDTRRNFDEKVKELRENLIGLRRQLPVLIRDDSVLGHFGLEDDVPEDVDLLLVNARICRDYWESLCDPDPPVEYDPLAGKLDATSALVDDTEDAQRAYADAIRGREEARVVKDEAREAVNDEERGMFAWYRGIWTDPEDDRWSATPWGASGGSSGGGEEPGSWEDAVTELVVVEGVGSAASIRGNVHPDADGVAIFMAITEMGITEPPARPDEPFEPLVPSLSYDMPVEFNVRVWLWVCHVKDGAYGAMAGPVWIEIEK